MMEKLAPSGADELGRLREMARKMKEKAAEWEASASREDESSRWQLPLRACASEVREILRGDEPDPEPGELTVRQMLDLAREARPLSGLDPGCSL
jgi:hypothetical protein